MDFTPVSPLWRAVQVNFLQHLLCLSALSAIRRLQTSHLRSSLSLAACLNTSNGPSETLQRTAHVYLRNIRWQLQCLANALT